MRSFLRLGRWVPVWGIVLLGVVRPVTAQVTVDQARELARLDAQKSAGSVTRQYFSIHPREDLEELFYSLISFGPSGFVRDPYFFEVSEEGKEFAGNTITVHTVYDATTKYIVAVSAGSGRLFRLNSLEQFNALMKTYRINIRDDSTAMDYLGLYLAVAPERLLIRIPYNPLQLKQFVEEEFFYAYPALEEADLHFDAWWKKNGKVLTSQKLGPVTSQTNDGYLLTCLIMSSVEKKNPSGGPALLRLSLEISRDGHAQPLRHEPVHPH